MITSPSTMIYLVRKNGTKVLGPKPIPFLLATELSQWFHDHFKQKTVIYWKLDEGHPGVEFEKLCLDIVKRPAWHQTPLLDKDDHHYALPNVVSVIGFLRKT